MPISFLMHGKEAVWWLVSQLLPVWDVMEPTTGTSVGDMLQVNYFEISCARKELSVANANTVNSSIRMYSSAKSFHLSGHTFRFCL